MKILAIRGEGLASLARPFEVDLEAPPLRDAGVFAIVGPTGAGKSTLLDAICLALFDRTPRLAGRGPKLGGDDDRDALSARDPRHVLRRGVGRAFAEVDFRGIDGRAYRARWEVRRARNRPDGRLQDSTVALVDLESGRDLGDHRKTETLREIEARLGLSFEQLTRAVLLAQGEFASFLTADDRERAELLERMTGTEIYGLVSIETARRAREERAVEARLVDRATAIEVMDDAARAELEARLPEQRLDVVRATARTRDLERQARWWADLELFAREEDDARRELAELDGQLGLAEARRRELEELVRAESVRADLAALDRARAAQRAASEDVARAERGVGRADEELRAAEDLTRATAQASADAERVLAALAPRIVLARELERAGSVAAERVAAARRREADRRATLESRSAALEALRARRREHARRVEELAARRRALAAVDALHDEPVVPSWTERIERAGALGVARAEAAAQLARARASLAGRDGSAATLRIEASAWAEALAQADARVGERRSALAREPSPQGVRAALRRLGAARDALACALEDAARADAALARGRELARAAETAAALAADARDRSAAADADLAALAPALAEAERARDLARATLELADRRADLRDGEECPLCGATDHPFARHEPAERLAGALDARAVELRGRIDAARAAMVRAEAEAESAARAQAWAVREQARAEREQSEARAAHDARVREAALGALGPWWRALEPSLRALVVPMVTTAVPRAGAGEDVGTAVLPWIESAPGAGEGALSGATSSALARELDAARARLEAARERREPLERALALAIEERERAGAAHQEADRALRQAESMVERERARAASLARDVQRIDAELAALEPRSPAALAALVAVSSATSPEGARSPVDAGDLEDAGPAAGWPGGAPSIGGTLGSLDGAALERFAAALADTAAARRGEALARAALGSLEAPLEEAVDAHRRAAAQHAASAQELDAAAREHDAAEQRRADLGLDDVDRAEREHRARVEAAREAHGSARARSGRAEQALEGASRERAAAAAREAALAAEVDALEAALATALARASLDERSARSALSRPSAEIAAWRRDLDALDARRARARAVLEERVRRRERHAIEPAPGSRGELDAELGRARELEEAARRLVAGAEERMNRDERARTARAAVLAELDAQRARVRTWTALESLIGSSDGKRFRVYAQGLTLDLLLSYANQQLERIAPRYALRRAPAAELAIQVIDREMGDEVRGVHGLSGGETFLVSLALALALASIAARRVPVGSLFVDEGFGGLDGESLEVALAALDALQASGRQVGVISHVPALAERFAARVEVQPCGGAESAVRIVG